jgi:3-phosphoshikimate 1-carboxyvinyltransferase
MVKIAVVIKKLRACSTLRGEITPPGDKSISHRAIILNGIAGGKAKVTNFSPGADCLATLACLRALGVKIEEHETQSCLDISGVGSRGLSEAEDVLDAKNSATTMRLLTGLLAAQPFLSIITGDESLRSRPMGRIIQPLRLMGAEIYGRRNDSLAPLVIRGRKLHGISYSLPIPSAQLKSALILAALFAQGESIIEEPIPSRDHTERLLRAMGAEVRSSGHGITIASRSEPLAPLDLHTPGDISSAAYWLVAGAIHPNAEIKIINTGINPTRAGIIDVLLKMGANLKVENRREEGGEPVADIVIQTSGLVGIEIEGEIIPRVIDEIPVIAVAACAAKGTTTIRDAAELRVKETDRISAITRELSKLGAEIEELPDGMIIHGVGLLRGAECDSLMDHRLAMALGIAALIARGESIIHNAQAADISYPTFWRDMERLSR